MIPRFLINLISWKSVSVLAIIAFILQVISILLTWHLNARLSSDKDSSNGFEDGLDLQHLNYQLLATHSSILNRVAQWSLLDNSGNFKFATGILRGTASLSYERQNENQNAVHDFPEGGLWSPGITLVTQCSLNHLHLLPSLADQWQGPLSVAVFLLSGELQSGIHTFLQLHKCFPSVKSNVTFSIVYPLNSPTSPHLLSSTLEPTPCEKLLSGTSRKVERNFDFSGTPYPNNLLRNTARKTVHTPFMLVIDIDMVPSPHLQPSFMKYAQQNGLLKSLAAGQTVDKTVWVLPSYEIREGVDLLPQTKAALLELKQKGDVRPFYQELCWKCQRYTDYAAWEKYKDSSDEKEEVKPIYEVFWRDPWEPFYISRVNIPPYDERFQQYGFNRISQVCELHVSGYRFLVMDSAFLVHRGFKTHGGFHPSKDSEQERNRILFRQFKMDLKEKYPQSSRRCY